MSTGCAPAATGILLPDSARRGRADSDAGECRPASLPDRPFADGVVLFCRKTSKTTSDYSFPRSFSEKAVRFFKKSGALPCFTESFLESNR